MAQSLCEGFWSRSLSSPAVFSTGRVWSPGGGSRARRTPVFVSSANHQLLEQLFFAPGLLVYVTWVGKPPVEYFFIFISILGLLHYFTDWCSLWVFPPAESLSLFTSAAVYSPIKTFYCHASSSWFAVHPRLLREVSDTSVRRRKVKKQIEISKHFVFGFSESQGIRTICRLYSFICWFV